MNSMKKNIKRIFWLIFLMFMIIILYIIKFFLVDSENIKNNSFNPRLKIVDENIKRGQIIGAKGNIIAESVFFEGKYKRIYNYNEIFSHVVGFCDIVKYGLEEKYNFILQNLSKEVWQRISNIAFGKPLKGDSIVITLDEELQKYCHKLLKNNRGSIVIIEPSTGKIITMVSKPDFNPNNICNDWDNLRKDNKNNVLLNRATQGLYPPGSIYKVIMSISIIENFKNWKDYFHNCEGVIDIDSNKIHCYNNRSHGKIDLRDALKFSCNTYFAILGNFIGKESMIELADRFYFNKKYPFVLDIVSSKFLLNKESDLNELIQTSIGQGKTLVTPLHMALVVSAIANGGIMMEPYILDYTLSYDKKIKNKTAPKILTKSISVNESAILKDMMLNVVESGTGKKAKVYGIKIAGKTGTAENSLKESHGWFVGFAPVDNPKIAMAIIMENVGGAQKTLSTVKKIIKYYFKLEN